MPVFPRSACAVPGCPERATLRGRCATHARQVRATYDRIRGTRQERGYDNAWLRLVKEAIKAQPWCSVCMHPGSPDNPLTGDHIIPLSKGGTSTIENIRVLCRYHNSKRGNRD